MNNNVKIIDAIRKGKNNFSKKDVQKETGLAWGTMCKGVDALLEDGFIFARREEPSGRGRPTIPLCINTEAAFYIGIDIGASQTKIVVCNLAFNVIYRNSVITPKYSGEDKFFVWMFDLYDTILSESCIPREKLAGIGLSVSGNVDSEQGIIVSGGNFGLKRGANLHAAEKLTSHSGIPVFVVTGPSAAVCGEYNFGLCAGWGNIVTIGMGVGIGSGVVSNHHLLISQPEHPVGYVGHMLIPGNKYVCTCGFKGCLEAYSGGDFLALVAAEKIPNRPELHSAEALDRAASKGDLEAMEIMSTAASYNAVGIASIIQLYSPNALIFSGGQCRKDGFLYNHTLAAINNILPQERRQRITVNLSNLGKYGSALGAARMAYEKFF